MKSAFRPTRNSFIATVALFLFAGTAASSAEIFSVSIPSLQLEPGERVVAFQIQVSEARIAALPNTPVGWYLDIDNDPSWHTTLKGNIIVGTSALDPSFFRNFLRIGNGPSKKTPIELTAQIMVTAYNQDGNPRERTIELKSADFQLTPSRASAKPKRK